MGTRRTQAACGLSGAACAGLPGSSKASKVYKVKAEALEGKRPEEGSAPWEPLHTPHLGRASLGSGPSHPGCAGVVGVLASIITKG